MNKKTCSFIMLLLVMLLVLSVPAYAEGDSQIATIPGSITLDMKSDPAGAPLPSPEEDFTVRLTAVTEGVPMPAGSAGGVYEETVSGAGEFNLTMEYNRTGIFSYTLRQIPDGNNKAIYDETEYSLTVYATVDEEWNLGLTTVITDSEDQKLDEAEFTNVYLKLDPPVEKKVVSKRGTAPSDSVFTFAMIPESKDAPMPDNPDARRDEATGALYMDQKGPGSYEFGWMDFTQKDVGKTYVYTVREIPGKEKGYDYDTEIYTLTVKVTAGDGSAELDVTYENQSGESVDKAVFTNVYRSPINPLAPTTGDDTDVMLWAGLLAVSALLLAGDVLRTAKKKKKAG